jgi:hypothetical protein
MSDIFRSVKYFCKNVSIRNVNSNKIFYIPRGAKAPHPLLSRTSPTLEGGLKAMMKRRTLLTTLRRLNEKSYLTFAGFV